jgi:glycyl-tRNA synthetase
MASLEDIVSLAKRRGFVFQGAEIYGGLAGTFDYGPLGFLLRENIKKLWWKMFVQDREDMLPMDSSLISPARVWQASGHTETFSDPIVECSNCHARLRADHLEDPTTCPSCGKKGTLGEARAFNLLFPIHMGASQDSASLAYLRGETAQGMFVNFKNIIDTYHPKLPFGLAQVGKAFRNEIAPREFVFRLRELEQMEVEYFVRPGTWEAAFEDWHGVMHAFAAALGLPKEHLHDTEIGDDDRAHYSKRTIDFEFDFPTGRKELWGLAYRTDYDLSRHAEYSGESLTYLDDATGEKIVPHVIEPSLGLDRTMLAVLASAYSEDELGGETRTVLRLPAAIAPYRAAVFPLLKNKPELVGKAREVFMDLKKKGIAVVFDDNGNIGKRYRRQDEIGTPSCITIDFDTLGETPEHKDTVTIRDRDTGEQKRVAIGELLSLLS